MGGGGGGHTPKTQGFSGGGGDMGACFLETILKFEILKSQEMY